MAASKPKPCGRPIVSGTGRRLFVGPDLFDTSRCGFPRMYGKQQCEWHWLLKQPAEVQAKAASKRLGMAPGERINRVPAKDWPLGSRWCSGCQSFVPKFYTTGSKCKACASVDSHARMIEKVYDITREDYAALLRYQRGRCYICGRKSPSRRLAVDHDHETGAVRGLLCPDPERGCNHKVLGPLEANSVDGGLAAARRMVEYLEDPPFARIKRGEARPAAPVRLRDLETAWETPAPF